MLLKHRCVCVRVASSTWHGGSVACTAASQQEGHGFDSRMGRCWLWGAGPPQSAQCSGGLSPGPFCVECACSPRVHKGFLHIEPQHKNMQKNRKDRSPVLSLTKIGLRSPYAVKGYPLLLEPLEEGQSRMGKRQKINSPRPQACVCVCVSVCVLCRFHIFTCVFQCVVCESVCVCVRSEE